MFPPCGCYPENAPAPAQPQDPGRGRSVLGSEVGCCLVLLLGKNQIEKWAAAFPKLVGVGGCGAPVVIVGWELGVEGGGVLASITLSQYWPKRTYKHCLSAQVGL